MAPRNAGQRLDDPDFEVDGELSEEVEDDQDSDKGLEPETPESEAGHEDVPDEYFGVRLDHITDPEAKRATFETLKEANRVSNRRLQEIAELRKQAEEEARQQLPAPQQVEQPEEIDYSSLSDEELLAQAGLDPDLLQYEDFGKPVAEMVRRQLALEQRLEGMSQASEAEKWESQFYGKLESLESTHGKLPYDRETIESYAIERNIFDPDALYWSVMGPVLREAAQQPQGPDPRRELKRKVGGQPRRGSSPGSIQTKKPETLKEAFEVAKQKHNVPAAFDPFAFEE